MRTRFLIGIILVCAGCATSQQLMEYFQHLDREEEKISGQLALKIVTLTTQYAAGPESAESIGHAVASECHPEINALVALQAERLRMQVSDESIAVRWRLKQMDQQREWVWRFAVAEVVKIRSEHPRDPRK